MCADIARRWERYPLEALRRGEVFNYQYWHLITRNRYGSFGYDLPAPKGLDGKLLSTYKLLTQGKITAQEYNQIIAGLAKSKELELKERELTLKQKELDMQKKNQVDLSGASDEAIEAYWLVKEGKAKIVKV